MSPGTFRFDRFCLDSSDRRLTAAGEPVELNGRYLDALTLLVGEAGRLVSKDRFMDEVWRGIPVTDEALTQCIRTLRRALGDDAGKPRFIETVPKHGYRFIAPVEGAEMARADEPPRPLRDKAHVLPLALAGTAGGAIAGVLGGLLYGFAAGGQPGMGAVSVLLVVVAVTAIVALIGAAGVAFGIAALGFAEGRPAHWTIAGGALGGLVVGAIVKLVGLDAFTLLLGRGPRDIAGPFEGFLLGGTVGFAVWFASRGQLRRRIGLAALAGGACGLVIVALGGRMMAGSLASLAGAFPGSRLRLDAIGTLFGEPGFGPVSQFVTAALEGALFAAWVAGAMVLARRRLAPPDL
jgi:DNA-binding winged helix-turn-helix (wHTH) protein